MNSKYSIINTLILGLILVAVIVGGYVLVGAVRQATRPLESTQRMIQEQLSQLINPTPTIRPDPVTIIREVRSLSRLETVSYTVEKIITAESRQGPLAFLVGDKLLLVAHGEVIAGVDLGKLADNSINVAGDGKVVVELPEAEVFVATLDNGKSYIYDRETGVMGLNPALETDARRVAEDEILQAALDDGILGTAQRNAETYVRRLILALGFDEVAFIAPPATPTPAAVATAAP